MRAELRDDTAFVATATPRLTWTVESDEPGWLQAGADLTDGAATVTVDGPRQRARRVALHPARRRRGSRCLCARPLDRRRRNDWSDPIRVDGRLPRRRRMGRAAGRTGRSRARRAARPCAHRLHDRPAGAQATLFWTALGAAEPELNGTPVSDDVLSPGWTSYRDRLVHETVDVTALVREGENVLGATIAGAWYTEKYGFFDFADRLYGTQPSFLAQLRVTYADGAVETLAATGDGWQAFGDGPIVDSGIYPGEHQDLRLARARLVDAGLRCSVLDAGAHRRRGGPGLRERPGARGADRAAGAPHRLAPRRRDASRHPRAARSSISVRTSSGACGCACAARQVDAS